MDRHILMALIVCGLTLLSVACSQATAAPNATPTAANAKLSLVSVSGARQSEAWYEVRGMVRNVTNDSLRNVQAVAILMDRKGKAQFSEQAVITYNPLLAGQTSSFSIMVKYNPEIGGGFMRFKQDGVEIVPRDEAGQAATFIFK